MDAWKISVLLAIFFALGELAVPAFGLLGMSAGMLAVAVTQYLGGGLELTRDILVFAVGSAIAFFAFRAAFRSSSDLQKLGQDDINQY